MGFQHSIVFPNFSPLQSWGGFVPVSICLSSGGLWHVNLRLQWDEKTLEIMNPLERWRRMQSWLEEDFPALSQSDRQKDPLTRAPVLFCSAHSLIKETAHTNTCTGCLCAEPCSAFRSDPADPRGPTVNAHRSIRGTKSNTGAEEVVKGEEFDTPVSVSLWACLWDRWRGNGVNESDCSSSTFTVSCQFSSPIVWFSWIGQPFLLSDC